MVRHLETLSAAMLLRLMPKLPADATLASSLRFAELRQLLQHPAELPHEVAMLLHALENGAKEEAAAENFNGPSPSRQTCANRR